MSRLHLFILTVSWLAVDIVSSSNLTTHFMALRRRRSLSFDGGGSVKFSVSGIWPLYLDDRVDWRRVNCIASVQSQYELPREYVDPWSRWQGVGKSLQAMREQFDRTGRIHYDVDPSRMFIYAALEEYMNRNGRNGRECLLRSICENAQIDIHTDVLSRILDVVLTPGKGGLDEVYRNAMEAGRFGVDCLGAYPKCPFGDAFLDRLAVVM